MSGTAHQRRVDTQQADVTACMIRGRAGSRSKQRCIIFTKLCQPLKSLIDQVSAWSATEVFWVLWLNNYRLTRGWNVHMYKVTFSPVIVGKKKKKKEEKWKGLVRVKAFLPVFIVEKDVLHHWGPSQGQVSLRGHRLTEDYPLHVYQPWRLFTPPCHLSSDLLGYFVLVFKKSTFQIKSVYLSQIGIVHFRLSFKSKILVKCGFKCDPHCMLSFPFLRLVQL